LKITVYTAIFADMDTLLEPMCPREPDVDFVCFSDRPRDIEGWRTIVITPKHISPRGDARMVKALPHLFLDTEYSIWHNGNAYPTFSPREKIEEVLQNHDLALYSHALRDCVYSEGAMNILMEASDQSIISEQLSHYEGQEFPIRTGLMRTVVIFRRHTDAVARLNEAWWAQQTRFCYRDQISLPFTLWKTQLPCATMSEKTFTKEVAELPHARPEIWKQYITREELLKNHTGPITMLGQPFQGSEE
jgi:hypothetical protein